MVSDVAIEDIERLAREGVQLSPREVIRLNALGLKMERPCRPVEDVFLLPRLAILTDDVVIHQPTLGHEIWLDEVARIMDMDDVVTNLSVHAMCLASRDADDLPDPHSRVAVVAALHVFRHKVRKLTADQIVAACRWATEGADAESGEYAETKREVTDIVDGAWSAATGVLMCGSTVRTGLTIAEARKLTRSQYQFVVDHARAEAGNGRSEKDLRTQAAGDYHATLDAIVARHRKGETDGGQ